MLTPLLPYRPEFPELLSGYCAQLQGVIQQGGHHDQRRALHLNFLRADDGGETCRRT